MKKIYLVKNDEGLIFWTFIAPIKPYNERLIKALSWDTFEERVRQDKIFMTSIDMSNLINELI